MKQTRALGLLASMIAFLAPASAVEKRADERRMFPQRLTPRYALPAGYWPAGISRPLLAGRLSPQRWHQTLEQARGHVAVAAEKRTRKQTAWLAFCATRTERA